MPPPGKNGFIRRSRRIFRREDTLYESGYAVAKSCVAAAAAVVVGEVHRGGRLYHICGGGAFRAGPAEDLRLVGIHGRHQNCILICLGSSQLQRLVFSGQGCNLVIGQEVQDGPGVGVLVFQNIPGVGIHDVAKVTEALCHVVIDAVDCAVGVASAVGDLTLHAVEAAVDAVVQGIGGVTDALLDCGDAVGDTVQRKALVDIGPGCIALEACAAKAATIAETTEAAARAFAA